MALHCYFKISVDFRLVLASLQDGYLTHLALVQTAKGSRRSSLWFSSEAMEKATNPTGIRSWPTVLSKEIPCLREVGNRVNYLLMWRLGREAWHSKVWSFAASCLRENKNRKNFSKVNTTFSRNFAPGKISHYTVLSGYDQRRYKSQTKAADGIMFTA